MIHSETRSPDGTGNWLTDLQCNKPNKNKNKNTDFHAQQFKYEWKLLAEGESRKVFRIGTVCYTWPMSAHASQAFSIAHCTDSEDLPQKANSNHSGCAHMLWNFMGTSFITIAISSHALPKPNPKRTLVYSRRGTNRLTVADRHAHRTAQESVKQSQHSFGYTWISATKKCGKVTACAPWYRTLPRFLT